MLVVTNILLLLMILLMFYVVYIDSKFKDKSNACEMEQYKLHKRYKVLYEIILPTIIAVVVIVLVVGNLYFISISSYNVSYVYKAELNSGEVVEARECYLIEDKATCQVNINGEQKEYVVTSYRTKDIVEIMFE